MVLSLIKWLLNNCNRYNKRTYLNNFPLQIIWTLFSFDCSREFSAAVRARQNWSSADNVLHQVHFLQEVSSSKMPPILTKAGVLLQCVGVKRSIAPTKTSATQSCLRVKWLGTRVLQLFGLNLFSRPGSHGLFHPLRVLVNNINYVSPDSWKFSPPPFVTLYLPSSQS